MMIHVFPNASNTVSLASEEWMAGDENHFFITLTPQQAKDVGLLLIEAGYQAKLNEQGD